jgi:hypothetical protein
MASQHVFQESPNGHHTLKLRPKPCRGRAGGYVQYGICYGSIGDNYNTAGVKLKPCRRASGDEMILMQG